MALDQVAERLNKKLSLAEISKLKSILEKVDKPYFYLFKNGLVNLVMSILLKPDQYNEQIIIDVIEYLKLANDHNSFIFLNSFYNLYAILFQLIDVNKNSMKGNCLIGEDLKLKVILLIQDFFDNSNNHKMIQKCIKLPEFRPILGHSIHVLLSISLNESYKRLQVESIITLNTIILKFFNLSLTEKFFIVQDIFAFFFPGISIKLLEVITKDNKIPQKLAINCLKTLSSIAGVCLSNYGSYTENYINEPFCINRNPEWFELSLSKLKIVIEKLIYTLITNNSDSVRKELVIFSRYLLLKILPNIPSIIESKNSLYIIILKVPLTLLYDDTKEICICSNTLLEEISDKIFTNQRDIFDLILDEFYYFLIRLNREIQWVQEDQKLFHFKLLTGYLKCLSNLGLSSFLTSETHQQKLFHCLLSCLQLDEKFFSSTASFIVNLNLNENKPYFELEKYPKKKFKWFDSSKCESQLRQACYFIGKYSNPICLIDYFTNIFQKTNNTSLIFIINSLILGVKDLEALLPLFEEYISLFTNICNQEVVSFNQMMSTCLLTEGIVVFAHIFGKSKQYYILMNVLYHILANIASQNQNISETSMVALNKLSQEFHYLNMKEIIIDNVDYLINYLNINLKQFESDRKYLAVMSAIFTLTDISILQYFSLTIENILATLDIYYYIRCDNLVDALNIIVSYIYHQVFKNNHALTQPVNDLFENKKNRKIKFKENLVSFLKCKKICDTLKVEEEKDILKNIHEWKNKTATYQSESYDDDINENYDTEETKKPLLPYHIELVKQILEKCYNLMAVPDVKVRLIILDIIIKGIEILAPFEDDLFPICHKIWPSLVARLKEKNILVIMKAFVCLLLSAKCCKDFLRCRTVSEIIPHLINFVKNQAKESYKKSDQSSYRFTIEHKLQLKVLSETGLLCFYLNLEGERIWSLIDSYFIYLNKYQPKSLQNAAILSLEYWFEMDPTAVRFLLNRFRLNQKTHEFESNIRNLLQKRT